MPSFSAIKLLKEIFFPIFCVECGREKEWWCASCRRNKINFVSQKSVGPLNGTAVFLNYAEGETVAKLIKQFKYQHATDMKELWRDVIGEKEDFLVQFCRQNNLGKTDLAIVPVPLHPRRERERGYNQAKILALLIVDILKKAKMEVNLREDILFRKKYTSQQAKLNKEARAANMAGVFACGEVIADNVIIVDDVYTTGATMRECAKVLRQHGTRTVWGVALARGD